MTTSFAAEVQTGSETSWHRNGQRFATEAEAQGNVDHLAGRWFAVTATRVVETDDAVTHVWEFPGNRAVGSDFVYVPPQRVTL
jgi:hypothetical protein